MKKLLVSVLVGVVSLAGCSSTSTNNATTSTEVSDVSTSVPESSGSAYSLIGGGSIDLTRGPTAKPLALWFWAPG
jgi:uncharacterized protein YceK